MPVSTPYGETSWNAQELAGLHGGIHPASAIRCQVKLETTVVEDLGPAMAGMRADQAADRILAFADRVSLMASRDRQAVKARLTHLMKLVNDREAAANLDRAARRLDSGPRPAAARRLTIGRATA